MSVCVAASPIMLSDTSYVGSVVWPVASCDATVVRSECSASRAVQGNTMQSRAELSKTV